jgi:hypothetical protein
MTGRRLFGTETEYAVVALDRAGRSLPPGTMSGAMLDAARRTLPHLVGSVEAGLFLANGSRLYVDAGDHPELASPECLDPWAAVRYAKAGHLTIVRLARTAAESTGIASVNVFAGNVDYSGTGATWGSHESYCHHADTGELRRRLLPHLVSRVIYCGAGGFNPLSPGLEFTLSPRSHHLVRDSSEHSTRDRGIVHTRDQALAGHGYQRQHLLCGETLQSELGSWLRVGTTALVIALIEGGADCGGDVDLTAPLRALRTFAADVSCARRVATRRGESVTAIDIQRRYLNCARAHVDRAFMPPWTGAVCDRWEEILARLAAGPDAVSRTLDWAIKTAVYRNRAERRGFSWKALHVLSAAAVRLERIRRTLAGIPAVSLNAIRTHTALQEEARSLLPMLDRAGTTLEQLDEFYTLRRELHEVDTRWAQLEPAGVFSTLDAARALDHRVQGVEPIEDAVVRPPEAGRAAIRGRVVQRMWSEKARGLCAWDHVVDVGRTRRLDLADPFCATEEWQQLSRPNLGQGTSDGPGEESSIWQGIGRWFDRTRRSAGRSPVPR